MTTPEFYGVTKLDVEAFYSDRGLANSKRSLGLRDLKSGSFRCMHPDCSGSDIRWRRDLPSFVTRMKEKSKKEDTYSCICGATNKTDGSRSCGGIYQIKVKIDYEQEKKSGTEATNEEEKNG